MSDAAEIEAAAQAMFQDRMLRPWADADEFTQGLWRAKARVEQLSQAPSKTVLNQPSARTVLLTRASETVNGRREVEYSGPEDSFASIAALWTALFKREFTATDVALAMAAVKLARLSVNPQHADSWVDLAGYAACGFEVAGLELPVEA